MFCNKCGAKIEDTAVFCKRCGNLVSGEKEYCGKVAQPRTRSLQRKDIYVICASFVLVITTGIVLAFGIRLLGEWQWNQADIYGTWIVPNGEVTLTIGEDGTCRISNDSDFWTSSFTYNKDHTITIQHPLSGDSDFEGARDIVCGLYDKDRMLMTMLGRSIIFHRSADGGAEVQPDPGASLYGSWEDAGGTVAIDIYEDGNIRIWGLEKALGADAFTFTEADEDTLALTANLDSEWAEMFSLNLDYEIDGNVMTVEIADYTFELEKVE